MNFALTSRRRSGAANAPARRTTFGNAGLDNDMDTGASEDDESNGHAHLRLRRSSTGRVVDSIPQENTHRWQKRQSVVVASILDVIVEDPQGSTVAVEVFSTLPTAATILSVPGGYITLPALTFQSGTVGLATPTAPPATNGPLQTPLPNPLITPTASQPSITSAPSAPTSLPASNATSTFSSRVSPSASFRGNGTTTASPLHTTLFSANGTQTTLRTSHTRTTSGAASSSTLFGIVASASPSGNSAVSSTAPNAAASTTAAAATTANATSTNTPAIAGGVVGGIAGVSLFAILLFFLFRWRQRKQLSAPRELPSAADTERPVTSRSDAAMAQNPAAPPFGGAFMRGIKRASGQTVSSSGAASERGFQKISGRKIDPVLFAGGDGYGNPGPGSPSASTYGQHGAPTSPSIGSYYNTGPSNRNTVTSHVSSLDATQGSAWGGGRAESYIVSSESNSIPPPVVPERRNPGLRVTPLFGGNSPSPPPHDGLSESPDNGDVVIHVRPGPARQPTHSPGFVTPPMSPMDQAPPQPLQSRQRMRQDPIGRSLVSMDGSRDSRGSRFAEDIR